MTFKQRLDEDIKSALRAGDKPRLGCLRMLKSKLVEREVALRGKHGADHAIGDEEATQVVAAYAKQRRDSIDSYREGGREDLAGKEEAELAIVAEYLPQQLTEDEVREIVRRSIAECGAGSIKEMGAVMKTVMPRVQGKADGKLVNRLVRELLQGS